MKLTISAHSTFSSYVNTQNSQLTSCSTNKSTDDFTQEMVKSLLATGFTQKALAQALQTSHKSLANILSGKTRKMQAKVFSQLFRFYCTHCLVNSTN